MSSSVTNVRYPRVPGGALRSIDWLPTVSVPQSASGTDPDDTGWPSATRFVTAVPRRFPPAPDGPVPADPRAVTASAVISPLKIESPVTTLSARAAAFRCTSVSALAVDDVAETIEPSAGYAKLSTAGAADGGETTADVPAAVPPAGVTWTPQAVAVAPGGCAGPSAPAEPIRSRVGTRSRARRRRTVARFCQAAPFPSLKAAVRPAGSVALLARKLEEPPARFLVGAHLLVVREPRIGGYLLRDGAKLAHDRVPVARLAQKRLDPGLGPVVLGHVVVDEQL